VKVTGISCYFCAETPNINGLGLLPPIALHGPVREPLA
jgi:hypothetical protein